MRITHQEYLISDEKALLQPAADVRSLEQVFIVTEYNAG